MNSKILLITSALLLTASCSKDLKITQKGTFVSKFEKEELFEVTTPDPTCYLVPDKSQYIVIQSGIQKDTIQYMNLILSGNLQIGDSIWIYNNRNATNFHSTEKTKK